MNRSKGGKKNYQTQLLGFHKMKLKFNILKNMWSVFENISYKGLRAKMGKMWLQISSHVQNIA